MQKIIPSTNGGRLRKSNIKMVPERTNLKKWRLSLKQRSTEDLAVFLNIYFEPRKPMQSKAATTKGLLAITCTVP